MIFASGLKYVGVPTYPLGFVMGSILLAGAVYWLAYARPRRAGAPAFAPTGPVPMGPVPMGPALTEGGPERAQTPLDEAPVR